MSLLYVSNILSPNISNRCLGKKTNNYLIFVSFEFFLSKKPFLKSLYERLVSTIWKRSVLNQGKNKKEMVRKMYLYFIPKRMFPTDKLQ